ncbi:MAG TPA: hypothetical protein VMR45_05835 [Patescibacteria group bacterium]|nr:hypothetical protein [Patescibacteria group bacterium]
MAQANKDTRHNQRGWALGMAAVALIIAYLTGSRAIDTGSLQQYAITFALILAAVLELCVAAKHWKSDKI